MKIRSWVLVGAFIVPIAASGGAAEIERSEAYCDKGAAYVLAETPPDGLRYAPNREVDIEHVLIDVTPDFKRRTVAGTVTLRFKPIAVALGELRLDAVRLNVLRVDSTAPLADFQATDEELIFTFAEPIEPDRVTTVKIEYDAEPKRGLYFRTREMGYKPGDDHVFTQGEPHEARHWFPVFDSPNEKFTSEVVCHVPPDMTVISNGRRTGEEMDDAGLKAVRWSQEQPHTAYLIALCAGYFKTIEDQYGDLPLAFHAPPSYFEQAANSFRGTKAMLEFFEREIGVDYPWAKYDQVVVDDFVAGGMENTSLTILTTRTLFRDETENVRSSEGLVAHELAHQWFGDLVTCKDWSHTWLNEGFASYYDILFAGHRHGREQMLYRLFLNAERITRRTSDLNPIVSKKYDNPMAQFSYRSYEKGAWVLHMLRSELGEEVYREAIRTYLERHRHGSVVTEDLNQAVEEVSGRTFDRFFDQWVYHGRNPELTVTYRWLAREKMAKISIRQTQKTSDEVMLFDFPLRLRFKSKTSVTDREVRIDRETHDFYVPLQRAPEIVRIDPEFTLLASIQFKKPRAMLYAQLEDEDDVVGRLRACRALATERDKRSAAALTEALGGDPFYGVRIAASKALARMKTAEALEALVGALDQSDARVRRQVVSDLGSFFAPESREALIEILSREKNPEIAGAALRALGKYASADEVRQALTRELDSDSYRQSRALAAIGAMRAADDPAFLGPLRETIERRGEEFTSGGLSRSLSALAYLARNEENRAPTRRFIEGFLNDERAFVKRGAIAALGTLGDPAAIAVIETSAEEIDGRSMKPVIDRALQSLRETKKVPVELGDLRGEVLELKKSNKAMAEELEDLKKKVDASNKRGRAGTEKRRRFLGIF